mmetsp:Transcript_43144/g.41486  ORF Transcript_43144/g.41486 Transcript_43144/m.41486 type:complete len:198 (-) Transcript_43144:1044-1637(-)
MFYNDAIIGQNLLDLNWMGGDKKLHVGFPEKALDKYLSKMVQAGYKVAVIEQTETPKQLEVRNKKEKSQNQGDKCVRREISQMVTKGTFKDPNATGYDSKFVLSYKKQVATEGKVLIGVTFFDVQTLKIYIGQFEDDEHCSSFRTLISQIRPQEVIHEKEFGQSDLLKMLKNAPVVPVFTVIPPKNLLSLIKTQNAI